MTSSTERKQQYERFKELFVLGRQHNQVEQSEQAIVQVTLELHKVLR